MNYIKRTVIDGIPVEIIIEDTMSNSEKLHLLIEVLKEQIDKEFEDIILANNDEEKLKEYQRYTYLFAYYKKILKEKIEFETHKG